MAHRRGAIVLLTVIAVGSDLLYLSEIEEGGWYMHNVNWPVYPAIIYF
jgi:hypothetical protein